MVGIARAAPEHDAGWGGVDVSVEALLSHSGVADEVVERAVERLGPRLTGVAGLGLTGDDLAVVGQAYVRAIGRIVAAEAEVIAAAVARAPESGRAGPETLRADLVAAAHDLAPDTFTLLHEAMLERSLARDRTASGPGRRNAAPLAVAHVDVVNSTALLSTASVPDTHRLVDGLFSCAQAAIRGRDVEAVKYVGDGVILAGPRPAEVAAAALDCLERLHVEFDLTARAGLAVGPVVQRAGDLFGLAVNLAHHLTKAADPGSLMMGLSDADDLPPGLEAVPRSVACRGLEEPLAAVQIAAALAVRS